MTAIITVIREDRDAGVTPTLLNHEGALIASLRSGLCLLGFPWRVSHDTATDIVAEAFAKARARRPSWREAQPEFTDGGAVRNRDQCVNCHKSLEVEQRVYCGKLCFDAHRARMARIENLEKFQAIERLRNFRRRAGGS